MKKQIIAGWCFTLFCSATVLAVLGGGSGTAEDPYLIYTKEHLLDPLVVNGTLESLHFKLMADIDFEGQHCPTLFSQWGLRGVFDGNHKRIKNISMVNQEGFISGIFYGNAVLKNLTLQGPVLTVTDEVFVVGLLAGWGNDGTIDNCHVIDGEIYDTLYDNQDAGCGGKTASGITTYNFGNIKNSSFSGTITAARAAGIAFQNEWIIEESSVSVDILSSFEAGGLVGRNSGLIRNSSASGRIENQGNEWHPTGGLVAVNYGITIGVLDDPFDAAVYGEGGGIILDSHSSCDVIANGNGAGGLVGVSWSGAIRNCYASGSVSGHAYVGGLIGTIQTYVGDGVSFGFKYKGIVENSYATGNVSGDNRLGGFAGENGNCEIRNCYSTGSVRGSSIIGGFVGRVYNYPYAGGGAGHGPSIVDCCYSVGRVTGSNQTGGFLGLLRGQHDITHSFWDTQTSGWTTSAAGTGRTTAHMKSFSTFAEWDFENIWSMLEHETYPLLITIQYQEDYSGGNGSVLSPYQISTVEDWLKLISNPQHWHRHFVLVNTIDLTGVMLTPVAPDIDPITENFQGAHFTGTFDGQGFALENAVLDLPEQDFVGLFGAIGSQGKIFNLRVRNVYASGRSGVGGLAGINFGGLISNCSSSGFVTGSHPVLSRAGGLVGVIVGDGVVRQSYSTCSVSGISRVGGLTGQLAIGLIEECYATGDVSGSGEYIGGLTGVIYNPDGPGTIKNSYARGDVIGGTRVGGLVGHNSRSIIIHCYSTGMTDGDSLVGGFCGSISTGAAYQDAGNFWDTQTSQTTHSAMGQGRSTAQMMTPATFTQAGWDIDKVWDIIEHETYPILQAFYEEPSTIENPLPTDGQADVPINTVLEWSGLVSDVGGQKINLIVNGDFESGNFSGWTLLSDPADSGAFVINDSIFIPDGPDGPMPPYRGRYSAMSSPSSHGVRTIYQDVALPADAVSLTLHWADMIRNHADFFENPDQQFRVEIWNQENEVLDALFWTNPGDPLMTGWTERSADISAFAGMTVRIAFTEQATHFYFNVHIDEIRIECELSSPVLYDVYLGTDPSEMVLAASDAQEPIYNPCLLDYETTYYWQVVAWDEDVQIVGPVWSFTTLAWQPQPADGVTDVPVDTLLEWADGGGGYCDQTCDLLNGGFESGSFAPWVALSGSGQQLTPWNVGNGQNGFFGNGYPFEGNYCAQNGFDGTAGMYYELYQDVAIPACARSAILTWSDRIQWDMYNYGHSTLPREYLVTAQPAGGGTPLALLHQRQLNPGTQGDTGYVTHSVDLLTLAPSIAGKTIRIHFFQYIPEDYTGPAQFELDGISLTCGEQRSKSALLQTSDSATENAVTIEVESQLEDYEQIRRHALMQMAQETDQYLFYEPIVESVGLEAMEVFPASSPSAGQIVNGDFESGNFSGWTLLSDPADSGAFVINDSTFIPDGPDGPMPPYRGRYSAMSSPLRSGVRTIYQDVTLPADAVSLTLHWADMIRNHADFFENPDQQYRVEIWNQDNEILATLFWTNPGDPLMTGWTERSADISAFAGMTVRIAFTEQATHFYFNVHIDDVRIESEKQPISPVVYDVYLGTDVSQMELIAEYLIDPWWAPELLPGRVYYWQVVARNECGQTISPVWSFSMENTPPVADAGPDETIYAWIDGFAEVSLDGSSSYDPEGCALTYSWQWNGQIVAEECFPTITLPVGVHEIALTVHDGIDESLPDSVTITVVAPIEAKANIMPNVVNRRQPSGFVVGWLDIDGYCRNEVDTQQMMTLLPGNTTAFRQVPLGLPRSGHVRLLGFFDSAALLAESSDGMVEISLVARLHSGQWVYGTDTIRIINPGGPRRAREVIRQSRPAF